jgi:hypothetical protein
MSTQIKTKILKSTFLHSLTFRENPGCYTMTQFSSLFWASNQPCCLLQCSGTTLWVRLRRPLVFFVVPTCWETRFSSRSYSTYLLFLFFFGSSYRPSYPPRCSDTTLWVHLRCPLNFSSVSRSIGSLLPIGHHLTFLRSAKTTNRSAAKLICFFLFFELTCTLFDLSIALWLRHDLSKVAAPTPHSGACETWVPLGPHRPGSRPSPTSGSGLPEDPPTCQWAQPT